MILAVQAGGTEDISEASMNVKPTKHLTRPQYLKCDHTELQKKEEDSKLSEELLNLTTRTTGKTTTVLWRRLTPSNSCRSNQTPSQRREHLVVVMVVSSS